MLSAAVCKYLFAWLGMMPLAILNGGLRDCLYKPRIGDRPAHQVSTFLLIILIAGYCKFLASIWPLESSGQALLIGFFWLLFTLAFEFGFGHFVAGHSWSHLWEEYNVFAGKIWILIPLWVTFAPLLFFSLK